VVNVNDVHRIKRLRALLAQLEQLPATAERDRMVREVRARVVDVDTGVDPVTFLPAQLDSMPAQEPEVTLRRAPRAVARNPAGQSRRPRATAPPRPDQPDRSLPHTGDGLPLEADMLLCLDDSTPFSPSDADPGHASAPWTRGLRG
jgi:hypothetical protein